MSEQQTAPAKANLPYSPKPESFSGDLAWATCFTASSLRLPVDAGAGSELIVSNVIWSQVVVKAGRSWMLSGGVEMVCSVCGRVNGQGVLLRM